MGLVTPKTNKVIAFFSRKKDNMILKIKARDRPSLERSEAVRRPSLINQERLVHGNCDGEEVAFP